MFYGGLFRFRALALHFGEVDATSGTELVLRHQRGDGRGQLVKNLGNSNGITGSDAGRESGSRSSDSSGLLGLVLKDGDLLLFKL